jgi:hypothetical protein
MAILIKISIPSEKASNEQQHNGTCSGGQDSADDAFAERNAELAEQPKPDEAAHHANDDIAEEAKATAPDD